MLCFAREQIHYTGFFSYLCEEIVLLFSCWELSRFSKFPAPTPATNNKFKIIFLHWVLETKLYMQESWHQAAYCAHWVCNGTGWGGGQLKPCWVIINGNEFAIVFCTEKFAHLLLGKYWYCICTFIKVQKSLILIPRAWIRRRKGLNEDTLKHKSGYGLYKCSLSRIKFAKVSLLYASGYSYKDSTIYGLKDLQISLTWWGTVSASDFLITKLFPIIIYRL